MKNKKLRSSGEKSPHDTCSAHGHGSIRRFCGPSSFFPVIHTIMPFCKGGNFMPVFAVLQMAEPGNKGAYFLFVK